MSHAAAYSDCLLSLVRDRSLEWTIEDDHDPTRAATLLARKLSTRLPSFGEAFTQQVPLTRIRDIAHRNDIPSVSGAAAAAAADVTVGFCCGVLGWVVVELQCTAHQHTLGEWRCCCY
jgi:hypothetical protein